MALKESNMLPLGTEAPDFSLFDTTSNQTVHLSDLKSDKATVIMFICNHCPYVIHVNAELVKLAQEYQEKGVSFMAISSNDVEKYPEDAPDKMSIVAKVLQYPFPYLYDESQEVAKAYDAACTPDFYVFDETMNLAYRGRLDSSRPHSGIPLSGEDLRNALDAVLSNKPVDAVQYPSAGCSIKWKIQP
jgi:peroxiredoxin